MRLIRFALLGALPALAAAMGLAAALAPPQPALLVGVAGVLLAAGGWMTLLGREHLRYPKAWSFVALPVIFFVGIFAALLLVESRLSALAIAVLAAAASGRYAWNVLIYFHYPHRYRPYALASGSQALAILAVFFLGYDLIALATYLALPPWTAALGALGISAVVAAAGFISYKIPVRRSLELVVIIAVLLAQLFSVMVLLPVPPAVAGVLFALAYYALSGLGRMVMEGTFVRTIAVRYAIISGAGAALVLATARWI